MKPERIQFAALLGLPIWGIFRAFGFGTYSKAEHFSAFVTDMAGNHGFDVGISIDSEVYTVTLEVPAEVDGDIDGALAFVQKVAGIYAEWSGPVEVS